ncbi:MAG: hypothetical protein F6J97_08120 [Leptolyngbya sp. SIO4C1]|nr:hypothetical protein [Leptolyngbya sp. SIO4C1]
MGTQAIHRFRSWVEQLLAQPRSRLIWQLSAVLVVLHGIDQFEWIRLPERLLALALLLRPQWLAAPVAWLGLSGLLGLNTLIGWSALVNHEYLITYWVWVCAIATVAQAPGPVLAINAQRLIGLCFGFATLWKLLGGEYLDGSFLHLTLLLDSRLALGARLLGRVSTDLLDDNQTIFSSLSATAAPAALHTTSLLTWTSLLLSYWTIAIEGLIAIAFLFPRLKRLHALRDGLLLLFILTTYTLIPVFAFAAILLLMGLAQTYSPRRQRVYLILLLLLPLWLPLPQLVFYLLTSIGG